MRESVAQWLSMRYQQAMTSFQGTMLGLFLAPIVRSVFKHYWVRWKAHRSLLRSIAEQERCADIAAEPATVIDLVPDGAGGFRPADKRLRD